ncbi:S-adenosyl-L-methionine-dependent methyltransferase [Copromyces sp. CBS 386.78]|nr:S-adenosyl-L-methionine-dependent methyltransferase [Copromyces sp. CBS 386.78]
MGYALTKRIEALIDDPQTVTKLNDDHLCRRLREAGRRLSVALETPGDTAHRVIYSPLHLVTAQIGVDKGIFKLLAEAGDTTLTAEELAQKTDIHPVLMKRLLRYYQAFDYIRQPADNQYGATNVTKSMTGLALTSGAGLFYHMNAPTSMALPKFLAKNNYQNPNDISDCPFQVGHNTDLSLFPWFQQRPEMGPDFLNRMNSHCSDLPRFYDSYDIKQELWQNADADTILFVDVGGAHGHQTIGLKQKYPDQPGRFILQDQGFVVERVKATPLPGFDGIEAQVYGFFTPQPLKGARAYYFRNVFHDWPNDICAKILANIRPAITEDSVILIDEIVLCERGSTWRATQFDIAMLTLLGASERTANEWHAMLDEAGFKIKKTCQYTEESQNGLIVAVPK